MRQLRHHDDHSLEADQGERHRLQRLWTLLQGPWKGSTHPAEEGRRADEEEEVDEEGGDGRDEQHHAVDLNVQLHQPRLLLRLLQLLQLQLGCFPTMPVLQRQLLAKPTSRPTNVLLNILFTDIPDMSMLANCDRIKYFIKQSVICLEY